MQKKQEMQKSASKTVEQLGRRLRISASNGGWLRVKEVEGGGWRWKEVLADGGRETKKICLIHHGGSGCSQELQGG